MRTIIILTMLFVLGCFAPLAYAVPQAEVESFTDNRDGTSTLTVRCFDDRLVTFTVKTKQIKKMNVDAIFALIKKECYKFYNEGK